MIFKKLTGIPQPNCKNHGNNFLKEIERPADHGWAKKKKCWFGEPLKRLFHYDIGEINITTIQNISKSFSQ